jgi:bifunctional non-homologous end joining protein LigD
MVCSLRFIPPCQPTQRPAPPSGSAWIHEVKFDGWRIQAHKEGKRVALYTRSGYDYARQFPTLTAALEVLAARSAIIDGEIVACDEEGAPDFRALQSHAIALPFLCIWAFDLLHLDGTDLRARSLAIRRDMLQRLVHKTDDHALRFSETFDDGAKLLASAEQMGLEGIVSKRVDSPYRVGRSTDWIKVKCLGWKLKNRHRWRLFEKRR